MAHSRRLRPVSKAIMIAILAALSIYLGKHLKERPGKLQNIIETGIEYLDNSFSENLGRTRARKYFYFLGSLFIFIIFANYSGLIPGLSYTAKAVLMTGKGVPALLDGKTVRAEKSFIPIPFLWELTRSSSTTALPTR